jgi:hypothetical protein
MSPLRRTLLGLAIGFLGFQAVAAPPVDQRLLVNGRINDHPVRFAFDTGSAAEIIVSPPAITKLKLTVEHPPAPNAPAGLTNTGVTAPVKLDILGKTFSDTRLQVLDVPDFLEWQMDGFIGWPALRQNIVIIQVADRKWSLADHLPAPVRNTARVGMYSSQDVLVLDAGRRPQHVAIFVDTGMSDGVKLAPQLWRAWRAAHPRAPTTLNSYFTPGAGLVVAEECWADEIELGTLTLHDVPVQPASASDLAAVPQDYAATLGLVALARVDLAVDSPHGTATVTPRSEAPLPYPHNRLGAVFVPPDLNHDELIAHVEPDTPAAAAGIRDGDHLIRIDDTDVTRWRADPSVRPGIRFLSRPAGTRYRLTMRRGGKTIVIDATLRDILKPRHTQSKS